MSDSYFSRPLDVPNIWFRDVSFRPVTDIERAEQEVLAFKRVRTCLSGLVGALGLQLTIPHKSYSHVYGFETDIKPISLRATTCKYQHCTFPIIAPESIGCEQSANFRGSSFDGADAGRNP